MKIYEIIDEEERASVGTLLYFDKERSWIIELREGLDEWNAPLLLTSYVRRGQLTIPRAISLLWVQERIIPSGRQNIQSILANHKLREYNEMKFLELSGGRCSQDSLYIHSLDHLPPYVQERMQRNLLDCLICDDLSLLCFFADGVIRKIALADLENREDLDGLVKIRNNRSLFESGKISAGGYGVTFNDSIDIPSSVLYRSGTTIPLSLKDFQAFVEKNLLDTTQSCAVLQCSRQNLAYLVKQGKVTPVKKEVKGNLYFKGDVIKNTW